VVTDSGLVQRDVEVHWKAAPRTAICRTDRLVPYVAGAFPSSSLAAGSMTPTTPV
jgi:hypothetical protein